MKALTYERNTICKKIDLRSEWDSFNLTIRNKSVVVLIAWTHSKGGESRIKVNHKKGFPGLIREWGLEG